MKYDFCVFEVPAEGGTASRDRLNAQGEQGFHLVAVVPKPHHVQKGFVAPPPRVIVYMQREVHED